MLKKKGSAFQELGTLIALAILVVFFSIASPIFLSIENLLNITRQVAVVSLLAVGMTIVIISGGIDLSVGSIIAFVGIITSSAIKDYGIPILIAIIIGLFVGAITGIVNGSLISFLNMPAFITTMGTMTILRGLGYIYTSAYPIYNLPKEFKLIGQGFIWSIPIPTMILIVVAIVVHVILSKTVFGRHIYAIGGNSDAAKYAGINVHKVKILVYIINGVIAGLAAVVQTARVGAGMPTIGEGFELEAVASVVIGGAAMSGGSGSILGTILGSVVLGVLSNGLSLLNVDSYVMQVVRGLIVILAVLLDQVRIMMSNRTQIRSVMSSLRNEQVVKQNEQH